MEYNFSSFFIHLEIYECKRRNNERERINAYGKNEIQYLNLKIVYQSAWHYRSLIVYLYMKILCYIYTRLSMHVGCLYERQYVMYYTFMQVPYFICGYLFRIFICTNSVMCNIYMYELYWAPIRMLFMFFLLDVEKIFPQTFKFQGIFVNGF